MLGTGKPILGGQSSLGMISGSGQNNFQTTGQGQSKQGGSFAGGSAINKNKKMQPSSTNVEAGASLQAMDIAKSSKSGGE